MKTKGAFFKLPFAFGKLFSLAVVLCNDCLTLVVTASGTNSVSEYSLAALRALYDVGGGVELPNARASLHLSSVRNFSLRYCHLLPPVSML